MACLAERIEYPDYINQIIKIILSQKHELRACLCKLKIPTKEDPEDIVDGQKCPIFGDDQKIGLFPFCIEYLGKFAGYKDPAKIGIVGKGTTYPVRMNLQEAMFFYWKIKTIKFKKTSAWESLRTNYCLERQPPFPLFSCGDLRFDKNGIKEFTRTNTKPKFEWVCSEEQTLQGEFPWKQRVCDCEIDQTTGKCINCKTYDEKECKYKDIVHVDLFMENMEMKMTKEEGKYWFYPYIVYESQYRFRPYTGASTISANTDPETLKIDFYRDRLIFPYGKKLDIHIFDGCEEIEPSLQIELIEASLT